MLQQILADYRARFLQRYGHTLTDDQHSALNAMLGCRQGQYGELELECAACAVRTTLLRSCGHRACNQCQNQSTQAWLDRQRAKQLPVKYYMATFTLPSELREVAKHHPKDVYDVLMKSAALTLKRFGMNDKTLHADLGLCAVLHTHTRRLDYHPHVHVVIPGGGINKRKNEWRKVKGNYLFNGRALAKAFRGECLAQLAQLDTPLPATPAQWIVQCQQVGYGTQALQYLARYLYRGVVSNHNIVHDDGEQITFQYTDSQTQKRKTRTVAGETFIYLLLQHVLPKGFRRARDYGFLHGNAKRVLRLLHWLLNIEVPPPQTKSALKPCSQCQGKMRVNRIVPARASP